MKKYVVSRDSMDRASVPEAYIIEEINKQKHEGHSHHQLVVPGQKEGEREIPYRPQPHQKTEQHTVIIDI